MPRPVDTRTLRQARLVLIAIALVLVLPVVVYVLTFGTSITPNHTRWSEMGSAMAGIYAPILSVLTLLVLFVQVQLQGRLNEHTFDQSYVLDARGDLNFYLDQLVNELSKEFASGVAVEDALREHLAYPTREALSRPENISIAKAISARHHRLVAMWSAVYGILAGLRVNDYPPYSNNYATAKLKAVAMLSYEICVALDNLAWLTSEGRLSYSWEFSSAIAEKPGAA